MKLFNQFGEFPFLTLEEFGVIGTLLISIAALFLSILAYKRGRNIDLQNQLHLKRLEAYESIIGEFQKVLTLIQKSIEKINSLDISNLHNEKIIELDKLADQIDLEVDNSRNEIAKKSAYFSKEFIEEILKRIDTLYGELNVNSLANKQKVNDELYAHLQLQANNFELLIIKMRDELGLDHLNQKLLKRIKKGYLRNIN